MSSAGEGGGEEEGVPEVGWAGRLAQVEGLLGRRSSWKNRLRLEEKTGMENKTTESRHREAAGGQERDKRRGPS